MKLIIKNIKMLNNLRIIIIDNICMMSNISFSVWGIEIVIH